MQKTIYFIFLLVAVYLVVAYYKGTEVFIKSASEGVTKIIGQLQGDGKYAKEQ